MATEPRDPQRRRSSKLTIEGKWLKYEHEGRVDIIDVGRVESAHLTKKPVGAEPQWTVTLGMHSGETLLFAMSQAEASEFGDHILHGRALAR